MLEILLKTFFKDESNLECFEKECDCPVQKSNYDALVKLFKPKEASSSSSEEILMEHKEEVDEYIQKTFEELNRLFEE